MESPEKGYTTFLGNQTLTFDDSQQYSHFQVQYTLSNSADLYFTINTKELKYAHFSETQHLAYKVVHFEERTFSNADFPIPDYCLKT